jgi:hypothetical protein
LGTVIRFLISWVLKAIGVFFIVVAWLAYFEIWKNIGSFSLDFIHNNLGAAIGLTIGGAFLIAFSSSIARLGE